MEAIFCFRNILLVCNCILGFLMVVVKEGDIKGWWMTTRHEIPILGEFEGDSLILAPAIHHRRRQVCHCFTLLMSTSHAKLMVTIIIV